MSRSSFSRCLSTFAVLAAVTPAQAQSGKTVAYRADAEFAKIELLEVVEAAPQSISQVTGVPFTADAVTEFTQVLGDGNRIERRYASSIARDGRGRTRREEDIVLLGPLAPTGPTPKLVTIEDPVAGVSYSLDQSRRTASKNPVMIAYAIQRSKKEAAATAIGIDARAAKRVEIVERGSNAVTELLGRRTIENVIAEGTRTTSTIPAGAIGNLQPIEIVSERWFSPELQMPVLIRRSDPRTGETVYRLINIVRAEPPPDLFTVPPDYEIQDGKLGVWKKLEATKLLDLGPQKGGGRK
jgi:hypothetical protein